MDPNINKTFSVSELISDLESKKLFPITNRELNRKIATESANTLIDIFTSPKRIGGEIVSETFIKIMTDYKDRPEILAEKVQSALVDDELQKYDSLESFIHGIGLKEDVYTMAPSDIKEVAGNIRRCFNFDVFGDFSGFDILKYISSDNAGSLMSFFSSISCILNIALLGIQENILFNRNPSIGYAEISEKLSPRIEAISRSYQILKIIGPTEQIFKHKIKRFESGKKKPRVPNALYDGWIEWALNNIPSHLKAGAATQAFMYYRDEILIAQRKGAKDVVIASEADRAPKSAREQLKKYCSENNIDYPFRK